MVFRGEKSDEKLNELSAAFPYFVLRVRKKKPRKKDKGKNYECQHDSSSLSATLKRTFTCFRSHGAKRALKDFNQNGGLTTAVEGK